MKRTHNSVSYTASETAVRHGEADGCERVDCFLSDAEHEISQDSFEDSEDPASAALERLRAACRPGTLGWDEAAINAGAYDFTGLAKRHEAAYWAAYNNAANKRAREILGG